MVDLHPHVYIKTATKEVLKAYGVKVVHDDKRECYSLAFPMFDGTKCHGYHYRAVNANGTLTRDFYYAKGFKTKCPMFGWQLITNKTETIVIAEGESDALSLASQLKTPKTVVVGAVGTGFARKVASWLLSKLDNTAVVLAFENDAAGEQATSEVSSILKANDYKGKLYRLPVPSGFNDVKDAIVGGIDFNEIEYQPLLTNNVRDSASIADGISTFLSNNSTSERVRIGFSPTLDDAIVLAPRKLVSVIGDSGCGKSTFSEQLVVECLHQGKNALMVSAEMSGEEVALKMSRIIKGKPYHNPSYLESLTPEEFQALQKTIRTKLKNLKIVDDFGGVNIDCLDKTLHELTAIDCKPALVLVDHFLAMVDNMGDFSGYETLARELKAIADRHSLCVVVICHTRKPPQGRGKRTLHRPTLADIYGGGLGKWSDSALGIAREMNSDITLVETIKRDRMVGEYADVQLQMKNWKLVELVADEPNIELDDEDDEEVDY